MFNPFESQIMKDKKKALKVYDKVYKNILLYWKTACFNEIGARNEAKRLIQENLHSISTQNPLESAAQQQNLIRLKNESKIQSLIIMLWRSILDEIDRNSIIYDSTNKEYIKDQQTLWTTIKQIVKDTQESMPSRSSEQTTAFTNVLDIITNKINDVNTEQEEADKLKAAERRLPITVAKVMMEAVALKIAQHKSINTESADYLYNKWRSKGGGSQRRKPKTRRKKH
jgi:hypothetical protein